jgi:hypothetical protein
MGNANSIPNNEATEKTDDKNKKDTKLPINEIIGIVFAVLFALMCITVILVYNVPGFGQAVIGQFTSFFTFVYNNPTFVFGFLASVAFLTAFFIIYNKQLKSNDKDAPIFSTWAKDNWIYSIVVVGVIIAGMTYLTLSTKPQYNTAIPLSMWNILMQRRMGYITYFTIFLVLAFLFYFYEPWGLSNDYFGQSTFAIIFIGALMLGLVMNYTLYFTAKDMMIQSTANKSWDLFVKCLFILASLGISGGLIYWMINSAGKLYSTSSIVSYIINLLLIIVILGLTFKVLMSSHYIQSSPYVRLFINTVLYIPCILVYLVDLIVTLFSSQKPVGHKTELVLLGLGILLMVLYFTVPLIENQFVLQGGKQLINDPIYINAQQNVANYMQLNDLDSNNMPDPIIYDYNYGISFWFYLDSIPSNQDKYITVFNYGNKPHVLYKSSNNTLMITVKPNGAPNSKPNTGEKTGLNLEDIDSNGNVIVYTRPNMQLQKWNNLILNYNGGTLDIFYNGELVKAIENIVPYMTMDGMSVGEAGGLHGGLCNLIYFKNSLSAQQISYIYNTVKDKTPPTLYSSTKSLTFSQ